MAGPKHKNDKSWEPGKSANPGGRSPRVGPNGETLAQLSRVYTVEVLDRLMKIIRAPDDEIALKAITLWAERAWGKPKPAEEGEGGEKGKTLVEEMFALLAKKLPD